MSLHGLPGVAAGMMLTLPAACVHILTVVMLATYLLSAAPDIVTVFARLWPDHADVWRAAWEHNQSSTLKAMLLMQFCLTSSRSPLFSSSALHVLSSVKPCSCSIRPGHSSSSSTVNAQPAARICAVEQHSTSTSSGRAMPADSQARTAIPQPGTADEF